MSDGRPTVIIGGGIAGLAAGCYLQMNGYATRVLEMGSCCGGVCVSWKRGGYVFDGATNWLPGSSPASNLHGMLAELLDFSKITFRYSEIFIRIERGGRTCDVYTNADRLREELLRIAPEDAGGIRLFTDAIKQASSFAVPYKIAAELFNPLDSLAFVARNLPLILFRARWMPLTIKEFSGRLRNEFLRHVICNIFPHHDFFSMFGILMSLGWMHARSDGYPLGGSAGFTGIIEKRYRELGGEIVFGHKVSSILVQDDRACGVLCSNGTRIEASRVISAADGYETIFGLLQGRYAHRPVIRRFQSWRVFPALIQISLGVNRLFKEKAHKLLLPLVEPLRAGGDSVEDMIVRICSFDPSLAPDGKTSIVVHLRITDYPYWIDLRGRDPAAYRREKERVARAVTQSLDKRFGGIADSIEITDVATPATYVRYTNNWKGSYQSWAPTPEAMRSFLPKTLPGLRGFYMSGHWLWPGGGLPAVIRLSRDVAQIICHEDGRRFTIGNEKTALRG
jgi:phytoene dehydrogenase-like protein